MSTIPASNEIPCVASDFELEPRNKLRITVALIVEFFPTQLRSFTYRQDLVAALQLSTQVGRAAGQDEGDKDPLAIFTTHDVEAQAGGALVEHDLPGFPVQTVQIVHQLGGVA